MSKRNQFVVVVGIVVIVIAVIVVVVGLGGGGDEDKVKRVAIVVNLPDTDPEVAAPFLIDPLVGPMAEWGYTDGENLELSLVLPGDGTLEEAVAVLADDKPDVILAMGPDELSAIQDADLGVPVVFHLNEVLLTDDVRAMTREPDTDVTGVVVPLMAGKRFDLLMEMMPDIDTLYVPYNTTDPISSGMYAVLEELAPEAGVTLVPYEFTDVPGAQAAVAQFPEDADAVFVESGVEINLLWEAFADEALRQGIPMSVGFVEELPKVLMGYGIALDDSFVVGARFVVQILDGTDPNELPIEYVDAQLMISLGAADALGIDVPDTVLNRATLILRDPVEIPPGEESLTAAELEGFCTATMTTQLGEDTICITQACAALEDSAMATFSDATEVEGCSTEGIVGVCVTEDRETYYYTGDPAMFEMGCGMQGGTWTAAE